MFGPASLYDRTCGPTLPVTAIRHAEIRSACPGRPLHCRVSFGAADCFLRVQQEGCHPWREHTPEPASYRRANLWADPLPCPDRKAISPGFFRVQALLRPGLMSTQGARRASPPQTRAAPASTSASTPRQSRRHPSGQNQSVAPASRSSCLPPGKSGGKGRHRQSAGRVSKRPCTSASSARARCR